MADLVDIKDMSPNQALIERLEVMLDQAKKGELRGLLHVVQFEDSSYNSGWVTDERHRVAWRGLIGELRFLEHDMVINVSCADADSQLSRVLTETE